ncbi:hypothetical protein JE959_000237 [Aeromonas veronii]|nr:hypothetical protein [Aeromonas veronii]
MIETKDKIANVFTVDSDVRVGSLPVDDFKKIMSDVKKDLGLHLCQLIVIGKVMFNAYFVVLKVALFILGALSAIWFYFSNGGFDENAKSLYQFIMHGVPDNEVVIARMAYWELIASFGMILSVSAKGSLLVGITALLVTYGNLFCEKFDIIEKIDYLACRLDDLCLKISEKKDSVERVKYIKKYCAFISSGFFGYRDLFHEKAELKIKSLLQEQTGEEIYVRIEDFS